MTNRVAYVHYPHWADHARLETMAFSLNSVVALARSGLEVDLYFCETDHSVYREILPSSVRIFTVPQIELEGEDLAFDFDRGRRYGLALGLGQIGVHLAQQIAASADCPLVFLNDEFPSNAPTPAWLEREREAVRRSALVVVPDSGRAAPLFQELGIEPGRPSVVLPNVPNATVWPQLDWRARFGLPAGAEIFLYAGTVGDWALVPEILSTIPQWPDQAVMVVHSRTSNPGYREEVGRFDLQGRIVWSLHPMREALLNSLTSACTGSFALYLDQGPNTTTMGFSSGKLMRSLVCGTPVIASRFDSLAFVEDESLGILVRDVREVPGAVRELVANGQQYRERCISFSRSRLSFDWWWHGVREAVRVHAGFEIPAPGQSRGRERPRT